MTNGNLKWRNDKKNKQWYTLESAPYANDGFSIKKEESGIPKDRPYTLTNDYRSSIIGRFYTLNAAKTVANLLQYGK